MTNNTYPAQGHEGFVLDRQIAHGMTLVRLDTLVDMILGLDEVGIKPTENPGLLAAIQEVYRRADKLNEHPDLAATEYWIEHLDGWFPHVGRACWDCADCGWVHHPMDADKVHA